MCAAVFRGCRRRGGRGGLIRDWRCRSTDHQCHCKPQSKARRESDCRAGQPGFWQTDPRSARWFWQGRGCVCSDNLGRDVRGRLRRRCGRNEDRRCPARRSPGLRDAWLAGRGGRAVPGFAECCGRQVVLARCLQRTFTRSARLIKALLKVKVRSMSSAVIVSSPRTEATTSVAPFVISAPHEKTMPFAIALALKPGRRGWQKSAPYALLGSSLPLPHDLSKPVRQIWANLGRQS